MKALFVGSFDPVTTGHLNLMMRSARMFEEVVVCVMVNPAKKSALSIEKRIEFLKRSTSHLKNVTVVSEEGLSVDVARKHGCGVLVRGIRNGKDADYEIELEYYNRRLAKEIETVYLSALPELVHVSSSRVKELAYFGQPLQGLVPEIIRAEAEELLKKQD